MGNQAKHSRGATFVKLLNGDFSKHLPIPLAFTKNFNGQIPQWLIIEVAGTRTCWRVDLNGDESGFYFSDGWDKFVEANTLEVGNFLVFDYKGPFILEVMIYNKDGSEKQVDQTTEFEEYKFEDYEPQNKTLKTHHTEGASRVSARTRVGRLSANQHDVLEKQQQVVNKTKKRPEVSITEHGVHFSIAWRETKNSPYYQTIPRAVVIEKNLSSQEGVVLTDREGNSWPVALSTRKDGRVDLTQGWNEFVNANQLTHGDTLTFEFSLDNQNLVHFARTSQADHPAQSAKLCRTGTTESLNITSEHPEPAANSTDSERAPKDSGSRERVRSEFRSSSFSATWKETTTNKILYIPANVAKEQKLRYKKSVVLCDREGMQWQLKVKVRQNGYVILTTGWSDFQRRHNIAIGDTLNFEFVSDCMMKVDIARASKVNSAVEWVDIKEEMEE